MDEHGGVSGIVTLEDVVEEIIGEIIESISKDNWSATVKDMDGNRIKNFILKKESV